MIHQSKMTFIKVNNSFHYIQNFTTHPKKSLYNIHTSFIYIKK